MSRFVNDQMDINETLAEEFGIKKTGRFKTRCPNPNHRDSDGSFEVYGEQRGGFCYGCAKSYYPLDIIMFSRDINYYEALQVAADEYEAELPQDSDAVKTETKADEVRYKKLQGMKLIGKKALHNYCIALQSIADEDDDKLSKYLTMKGIS